jgi:hypothetical protein
MGLGIFGWMITKGNVSNETTETKSTGTSKVSPYDKCVKDYNNTNLCHYYETALDPHTNLSFISTNKTNLVGHEVIITSEVDSNGNSKISQPGLIAITVDGSSYIQRSNGGTWVKVSKSKSKESTGSSLSANTFGIEGSNKNTTFKSLGTGSCGTLTCYKYEVSNCCSVPTTEWFSFDAKSYKLLEYYMSDSLTTTHVTYSYVSVPTIHVPSPVAQ